MIKKRALLSVGFFLITFISFAQIDPDATGYYTDALRFSQTSAGGTARFLGLGGVNNALGADLSSLSGNPAGLGFYQRSELGISAGFGFASAGANYMGTGRTDQRDNFYFPNLGMVITKRKDETEDGAFRSGAFGIGLTRIANFQNQFSYRGTNTSNSLADYFVERANGIPQQELYDQLDEIETIEALAYWTYIIDAQTASLSDTQYKNYDEDVPAKQEETVLTKGAINQWNFSYGGNINDQVYFGASLGIPMIRYLVTKNYKETYIGSTDFESIRFNEELKVRGTGINLKLGGIFKPQDWLRVGFTIQTPTYYGINEDYGYSARTTYRVSTTLSSNEKTVPGTYKYNLTTPFRASGGVAVFAGKAGFVAADIEYVPYSRARLKESSVYSTSDNSTFPGDNSTIGSIYKSTLNINLGGELRHKIYRLRGGFALLGDAYNNIDNTNRKVINISGGAGVRLENSYFDIAIVNSRTNSVYVPYSISTNTPSVAVKNSSTNFIMSAGVFF